MSPILKKRSSNNYGIEIINMLLINLVYGSGYVKNGMFMYFNGTIRRPWVWKLHWRGFYIDRNIFWKSRFYIYIFNGILSPAIYFWIFRKNNGRVQCNDHRDGKIQRHGLRQRLFLLIVRPNYILIFKKRYISYWKL